MACPKYSTEMAERKKGQHLRMEERGAIKALEKQGAGSTSHRKSDRMCPDHRDERTAARHARPKEYTRADPKLFAQAGGSSLCSEPSELSQADPNREMQQLYRMGGHTNPGTQMVTGCLLRGRETA